MTDASTPGPAAMEASVTNALETVAKDPDAPVRPAPTAEVARAHQELLAARRALAGDVDGLTASVQSALDIPAKIRRQPVKTAAIAGGAGFLLLGGPKRVVRAITGALPKRAPKRSLGILPDDVERILRDSEVARDPRVREALERDFADYLRQKGRVEPERSGRASFWRTYDALLGPLGTVGARMLVEKLLAAGQGTPPSDRRPGGRGPTAG